MRKYILLIIYITGLAFTQQGSNVGLPLVAAKMQRSSKTHSITKANHYAKYDCYDDSNFCRPDLNLEDDENAKSKPVYAASPSWLQADTHFIVDTDQFKYRSSFGPVFPFDLFKLNRVLRL